MTVRAPIVHVVMDAANDAEVETIREVLAGRGIEPTFENATLDGGETGVASSLSRHDTGQLGAFRIPASRWAVLLHTRVNELARYLEPSTFRDMIEELRTLRAGQKKAAAAHGTVLLVDEDTGVQLDLEFQLPRRAYEDLATLNLRVFHEDPVRFHRRSGPHGKWRPPH